MYIWSCIHFHNKTNQNSLTANNGDRKWLHGNIMFLFLLSISRRIDQTRKLESRTYINHARQPWTYRNNNSDARDFRGFTNARNDSGFINYAGSTYIGIRRVDFICNIRPFDPESFDMDVRAKFELTHLLAVIS